MKHVLSFFLFSSLSLQLFSSDEALTEMRGLFKIADENSKSMHQGQRNRVARIIRTRAQSSKERTQERKQNRDDKDFRQGNLSANHSLNVSYLKEVSRSSRA